MNSLLKTVPIKQLLHIKLPDQGKHFYVKTVLMIDWFYAS